jgi:hypothetical protein
MRKDAQFSAGHELYQRGRLTMFGTKKSRWNKSSAMKKIGMGMLAAGVTTAAVYGVRAYLRWRTNREEDEGVDIVE